MPTLEDIHARWSKATVGELQTFIATLQRIVERDEEHVLPRSRTSLAASMRLQGRGDFSAEGSLSRGDASSPPPGVAELEAFLSQKAVLLEMYAILIARHHLSQIEAVVASGEASIEACTSKNLLETLSRDTGAPLVCGACSAQLCVPRTNTSLRVDDLPQPLDTDPLATDSQASAAADKKDSQSAASTAPVGIGLPHILRIPLSEDNDFALNLDLLVDVPATAYEKAVARASAEESLRHHSLSVTPELSFLSGGPEPPLPQAEKNKSGTVEDTTDAPTTHATFSPEHFLWTMQQVPFTLSYVYGANDISSTTTRTSYATITSSAPRARGRRSRSCKAHRHRLTSDDSSDLHREGRSLSSQSGARTESTTDGSSEDEEDEGSSRSGDESEGEDEDDDEESAARATASTSQDPLAGPLRLDATCTPAERHASPRSRYTDSKKRSRAIRGDMVTVRLRVSFPSVRFVDKPEPLSLHSFLIAQPVTRYGPAVQMVMLVNILPPPIMLFRPTRYSPMGTRAPSMIVTEGAPPAAEEKLAFSALPLVSPEFDVMTVQGIEGTAKAYLIIRATDLLHSVDFTVRCGDLRTLGRPFIMYSKEFLGRELGQYLLPSLGNSSPVTPVRLLGDTGAREDAVLQAGAYGQEEWAVPIILPYKIPADTGALEVSLHLDVRFCCQPHRSFRQVFPLRIVSATAKPSASAAAAGGSRGRSEVRADRRDDALHEAATAPTLAPVEATEHRSIVPTLSTKNLASVQHPTTAEVTPSSSARSPPLIRSRLTSMVQLTSSAMDVNSVGVAHLRFSPQSRASAARLISTTRLHVSSFALCDGGALVMCAERVKRDGRSGDTSADVSLRQSPTAASLSRQASSLPAHARRHHTYRSFLGFSPMNAMNSCVSIDAVVMVPPAVTALIVAAGVELVRYLRPDGARASRGNSGSATPQSTSARSPNVSGTSPPAGGGHGHLFPPTPILPEGWQQLDLRYVLAKGWLFEARQGEPRAHNTAVLRDPVDGQCLVLRIGAEHIEEQVQTQRRETFSLPPDDPLFPAKENSGNMSSRGSGRTTTTTNNNSASNPAPGTSMEVIVYVPAQSRASPVAEQQFVADSLAVVTRTWDARLLWWARAQTGAAPPLLADCQASRLWELESGDGLTLIVVALGPRCEVGEEDGVVRCLAPTSEATHEDADAVQLRTVGVYCLEEKRLLYHFQVPYAPAVTPTSVSYPSMPSARASRAASRATSPSRRRRRHKRGSAWRPVTTGFEVVSRREETGAVLYWDSDSVVAVLCSPSWSHHEIFHVSSVATSSKFGRSLAEDEAGVSPCVSGGAGLDTSTPTIVAVTSTTPLAAPSYASEDAAGEGHHGNEWLAFVLLSDGRLVGLKYASLDRVVTPPRTESAAHRPAPLPSLNAVVVGTVFNPAFVNPLLRVRDIVLCYYAINTTERVRWSPLQSYTSAPSSTPDVFSQADTGRQSPDPVGVEEPGPAGVLYLYGVEAESNQLLKDAVLVES